MAFLNQHTIALDALGSSGCLLPVEQRAAIDVSLSIKKEEAGLKKLGLWGRVYTVNGKDYLLAQGCNGMSGGGGRTTIIYRNYYSQDGMKWLDLQPISDERFDLCKTIKGWFSGDPSHVYHVVVKLPPPPPSEPPTSVEEQKEKKEPTKGEQENEEEEEQAAPPVPEVAVRENDEEGEVEGEEEDETKEQPAPTQTIEFGELDRLTTLIRAVDSECGVVPVGALIYNAKKQLVRNKLFPGLKFPEKLDSYGHIYQGYEETPLCNDIRGSWSVQVAPITNDVILRSLWWPGYSFFFSSTTNTYGSLYFGQGEKNLDFPFMV